MRGRDLAEFPELLEGIELLVTYNGASFDLPVLRNAFPERGLRALPSHRLEVSASQARRPRRVEGAEKQLGITRSDGIDGVDGFMAVLLWREHRAGNATALDTLLRYCLEDVVNLKPLLALVYNRLTARLPLPIAPIEDEARPRDRLRGRPRAGARPASATRMGLGRAAVLLALAAAGRLQRRPEAGSDDLRHDLSEPGEGRRVSRQRTRAVRATPSDGRPSPTRAWGARGIRSPRTASIEDWTTHNTLDVKWSGLRYTMSRRDGKFFMRQSLLDAKGDGDRRGRARADPRRRLGKSQPHVSRRHRIEAVPGARRAGTRWIGSGICAPATSRTTITSRARSTGPASSATTRGWSDIPNQRNAYVEPIPDGIDCERCHGPGKLHVDRWARGETPTGEGDRAIVNPKRLPAVLRMQICFQCHLGDSKSTERVARVETALEDWRPGQPISAAMVPFRFADATPHDFGLSAQVDRLLLSRCYTESKGTHRVRHLPRSARDRVSRRPAGRLLHVEVPGLSRAGGVHGACGFASRDVASRRLRRLPHAKSRALGPRPREIHRPLDPAGASTSRRPRGRASTSPPIFPSTSRRFPLRRARSTRDERSRCGRYSVPPQLQRSMWPQAERAFRESIALGFTDPDAWFFLGKALTAQGKHREAAEAYATAHAKDPAGHDAAFAHGQALLGQRRLDDAERVFEAMTREHPESAAPLAELGRCRAQRGDFTGALVLFQKAIEREPWNASLHENAAMVLSALERHGEAMAEVADAIRLDPESGRIRESRATLQARAADASR